MEENEREKHEKGKEIKCRDEGDIRRLYKIPIMSMKDCTIT